MKFHVLKKSVLSVLVHCTLLLLIGVSTAYADSIFHVNVNTSALVGNPSGPFSLYFQFNDGGTLNNNSATISNFNYFGGSVTGSPSTPAFGSIGSIVSLNNSTEFQDFFQQFAPGAAVGFDVRLTTDLTDAAGTPDVFSFGILDNSLGNIPTNGLGDALLLVNINNTSPTRQTFSGTGAFTSVNVGVSAVPEPATWVLTLTGLCLLGFVARRRQLTA